MRAIMPLRGAAVSRVVGGSGCLAALSISRTQPSAHCAAAGAAQPGGPELFPVAVPHSGDRDRESSTNTAVTCCSSDFATYSCSTNDKGLLVKLKAIGWGLGFRRVGNFYRFTPIQETSRLLPFYHQFRSSTFTHFYRQQPFFSRRAGRTHAAAPRCDSDLSQSRAGRHNHNP